MSDLIAFVEARLAEDAEAATVADALTRSPWKSIGSAVICADRFPVVSDGDGEAATAAHIACWDPARVLAECEARRARVELAAGLDYDPGMQHAMLALEALPFADHPDFRAEWKP